MLALAPDASSVAAGRKLAAAGPWSGAGACPDPAVVWGECQGSGKAPYRAAVELTDPAFSCSCPSRKFPCKHALGLLLLWSGGGVPDAAEPVGWVAAWLAARAERAAAAQARTERPAARAMAAAAAAAGGTADPQAAQRRAQRRADRMASGLAELDQWLRDQVSAGLAGTERAGYRRFDELAARMVDSQLPGVASTVRRLASVAASGEGWPGRLLQEYALLHLLVAAGAGQEAAIAASVRAHLGVSVPSQDVLAREPVRDEWVVLGLRDSAEDRLTVRRVWLRGTRTGRFALVLSFAVAGQSLDASLLPGTKLEAELHFYPGAVPLRALVGLRHGPAAPAGPVPGAGLDEALTAWAATLAADPWTRGWPVVLTGMVPVLDGTGRWLAAPGAALPLLGPQESAWTLLAVSGGHPLTVFVELTPEGARPISVLAVDEPGADPLPGLVPL